MEDNPTGGQPHRQQQDPQQEAPKYGAGGYVNRQTHTCVAVTSEENGCGDGMVGDDVTTSATKGYCIAEDECTQVGFVNQEGRCVLVSHEDNQCGTYEADGKERAMVGNNVTGSQTKGRCITQEDCVGIGYIDDYNFQCVGVTEDFNGCNSATIEGQSVMQIGNDVQFIWAIGEDEEEEMELHVAPKPKHAEDPCGEDLIWDSTLEMCIPDCSKSEISNRCGMLGCEL